MAGSLIGAAAGLFATAFYWLLGIITTSVARIMGVDIDFTTDLAVVALAAESTKLFLVAILVPLGALLGSILVYKFAPEAEGHGTDAVIRAVHRRGGYVDTHVPLIKAIASALTIGFGGSGGVEGPSAQMGGGIGSIIARLMKLGLFDRRIAVVAGVSGALSAIFRAPIGTSLFAIEVLYKRDMEVAAFIPAIIASVVSFTITAPLWGFTEIFPQVEVEPYKLYGIHMLMVYMGLGLFTAPFALLYVVLFQRVKDAFDQLSLRLPHPVLKPTIGAIVTGIIGILIPAVLGSGRGLLSELLAGMGSLHEIAETTTILVLLGIATAKMFATAFSIGSGGSGGVFAPSIFIGALIGYTYGVLVEETSGLPPVLFSYLGMSAFFAAVSKTPLATSVMVAEMTGSYHLIVPALISAVVSRELTGNISIYESQMHHRPRPEIVSLEVLLEQLAGISEARQIKLAEIVDRRYRAVKITDSAYKAIELIMKYHQHVVPVVDNDGRPVGSVDASLLSFLLETPRAATIGRSILRKPPILSTTDSLYNAIEALVEFDTSYGIVVNSDGKYYGIVTAADLAAAALNLLVGLREEEKKVLKEVLR